jgi:hypothetical protein
MAEKKRREEMRSQSKTKKKKAVQKTTVTATAKQSRAGKATGKKVRSAGKKKRTAKPASQEIRSPEPSTLRGSTFSTGEQRSTAGRASRKAGQSGDLHGLSRKAFADSESVEELVEEGQAREAAAISGVEDALDHGEAEVHTHEVPQDDVPEEYTDED